MSKIRAIHDEMGTVTIGWAELDHSKDGNDYYRITTETAIKADWRRLKEIVPEPPTGWPIVGGGCIIAITPEQEAALMALRAEVEAKREADAIRNRQDNAELDRSRRGWTDKSGYGLDEDY